MQKDLLAELHLPKLDFKSIQDIVTKNSVRLASLLKENTNYVKKNKRVSPHFKEIVKSMVSDGAEINPPISISKQSIKTFKRKFIFTKSLTSNQNLKNGIKISCPPSASTKSPHTVGDTIQETSAECSDKPKSTDIQSSTTKCFCNSNISSSTAKLNTHTTANIELNSSSDPECFKGVVGRNSLRDNIEAQVHLSQNSSECPFSEPLSVNSDKEEASQRQFSKRKNNFNLYTENVIEPYSANDIDKQLEGTSDFEKDSEPAFCVISEVVGNATDAFSNVDDFQENAEETSETQLIIPQKTNDITKIKGWRRKQFFVEKPTTIEFYSIAKGSLTLKKTIELNYKDATENHPEEPDSVENAFVCDSLDEFLEQDAELKVGFEVPHLFAEFGIKLTRDEIVSKPNLSEKDMKEVESRYCTPMSSPCDLTNLDEIKEENLKRPKRPVEDDTKPCKILKTEENRCQFVRHSQKVTDKMKIESCEKCVDTNRSIESYDRNESSESFNNLKLVNKFIALVVYPGPFMALHPVVQYHLAKIRSYRTIVDKNWANFAASAVLVNEKRYKRRVLPVQCCVKIVKSSPLRVEDVKIAQQKINSTSLISKVESDNKYKDLIKDQFKLKNCSVVMEKLNFSIGCKPWCMEHSCYNCEPCGLAKPMFKKFKLPEIRRKINRDDEDPRKTVIVSARASFDNRIASLLAKKVRLLKYNGDTLTSIDCLKTLTPNTVEFIKLKFVKESLLTGYINIWYLKQDVPEVRSRAFLTFSQTPPVPNAVNLKSSAFSLNNLPKVITEIISKNNSFDSNEYAILHCNGEIWEIHGSLNIAFGKNEKKVEQIFSSVELPELKKLQKIAYDILRLRAVKWWVLDLTQKFKLIEIKSGNFSAVVVRKKFIETMALNLFGFIPLKRELDNRVLGAYVIQRLLPFILIGPYYLLESHDLTLKGESSTVPFVYYGQENVTSNYPLKFFINSVIKNIEQSDKKVEGLWLYDKMNLDSTSYLEVVTSDLVGTLPNKYSSIDIDHGYSLSSLTNSSSGIASGMIKRKDGKEEFQKITVYLYFDIFELGYVEGELQFDNSVIISHPLDRRTKMKSHKIGDWFIGIIKRRIDFIPKDLVVRWFITKHKDDLRDRQPFNKFFLGGAHILTKTGVYYLLEMSESKIEKLGLNKNDIFKAIAESEVIKEVKALKQLADLLPNNSNKSLTMDEILSKTVKEIKMQKRLERTLKNKKIVAQKEKLNLICYFLKTLNYSRIPFHFKMKMIENLEPYFIKGNEELTEEFIKKLKVSRIGRKYFKRFGKNYIYAKRILEKSLEKMNQANTMKKDKSESEKLPEVANPNPKSILKSSRASKTSIAVLKEKKADRPKYPELSIQLEKLNAISERFNSFKNIYSKVMKNSTLEKGRTK